MSWLDQAADGRVLEWEPHVLAAEVRAAGRSELAEEPQLRDPAEVAGRRLAITPAADGVSLHTDGWARLEVVAWPRPASAPGETGAGRSWAPPPASLRWSDLPPGETFDLTPFDAQGLPGVTTRLPRPRTEPYLPFDFSYKMEQVRDRIVCRPLFPAEAARCESLSLAGLQQEGHSRFRRDGEPAELDRGSGEWLCGHNLRGIVAVYGVCGGRRLLLDCRTVFDRYLQARPQKVEEWRAVEAELSCAEPGDVPWPARSHDRLEAIRSAAVAAGLPAAWVDLYPRGVVRFLVLDTWALAPARDEGTLQGLDAEPAFAPFVERQLPGVLPLLARTAKVEERLWILAHAGHANLAEIVLWAGQGGVSALDLAAELLPLKRRIQALAGKVRDDCPLGVWAAGCGEEVERLLRRGQRRPGLAEGIAAAEKELANEEGRPLTLAPPEPSGKARAKAWQQLRARSQSWRLRIERIYTFCERGEWPQAVPGGPPIEIEALVARAERLAIRFPVDHADDPAATARLRQLVEESLRQADDEPASAERERILDHLRQQVEPCPERWSALHAAIRRAGSLVPAWPQLATALALDAPAAEEGDEEVEKRRELFLRLIERLPAEAERWPLAPALLRDRRDLGALLTTPGHPRIAAAYAEAAALSELLAGSPDLPALPPTPPSGPEALSREGFEDWWRKLRSLDEAVGRLTYLREDQEGLVRKALDLVRSHLANGGRGNAAEGLADLLRRDPASVSRRELLALLDRIPEMERHHGTH